MSAQNRWHRKKLQQSIHLVTVLRPRLWLFCLQLALQASTIAQTFSSIEWSAGVSSTQQSTRSSNSYPEGFSADGIPPVLTDHITPGEQAPASSLTISSDSATHTGSSSHDSKTLQHPSALTDAVPTATDKGFAEPPAINTGIDRSASRYGTTTAPTSPSKSPSFLSRVFNTFLGSSAEPSETTAPRGYSNEAPSASWGRPGEPQPVEDIREAGTVRAAHSGLDEPTATKQAGLDAPSDGAGYRQSTPNTAVAAAESLIENKAGAQHDTAAASQHAPPSPGAMPTSPQVYSRPQMVQHTFALLAATASLTCCNLAAFTDVSLLAQRHTRTSCCTCCIAFQLCIKH